MDKQLVQIVINNGNNGSDFELEDIILAKEIKIKGYSFYNELLPAGDPNDMFGVVINPNLGVATYAGTKGSIYVSMEWLKINSVEGSSRHNMLSLPWKWNGLDYVTDNMNIDLHLPLPTSTSLRKRFRATVYYRDAAGNFFPFPTPGGVNFQLTLYVEVNHDHVFR